MAENQESEYFKRARELYSNLTGDTSIKSGTLFGDHRNHVALLAAVMQIISERPEVNLAEGISQVPDLVQRLETISRGLQTSQETKNNTIQMPEDMYRDLQTAQENQGRVPYVTILSCSYNLNDASLDPNLAEVNNILKRIPGEWKPEKLYQRGHEQAEFSGKVTLSAAEFDEFRKGDKGDINIVYRRGNDYLTVTLDLEEDTEDYDETKSVPQVEFLLTRHLPQFNQGVDDLESLYLPMAANDLVNILNKICPISDDPWKKGDMEYYEAADWYEKIELDDNNQ